MTERKRYDFLDALRGFAVINMVMYHFLYDKEVIFGGNSRWFAGNTVYAWELFICCTFILISGASWNLSKRHIRQGILLNLCGGAVTAVTVLFLPEESIFFGILTFLGCAALAMIPVDILTKKVPPLLAAFVSLFLFLITHRSLIRGYIGIFGIKFFDIPTLPNIPSLLVPFGFSCKGFYSSDYFPMLPWFFLYCMGCFLWRYFSLKTRDNSIKTLHIPFLEAVGRKSLIIYMLHQPICFGIAYLLFGR